MLKKYLLATLGVILLGTTIYLVLQKPQVDRNWVDYLATTTTATRNINEVTLTPVRDWTYGINDTILAQEWLPIVSIDPADIRAIWFVIEPFGRLPIIGHTFLTFELISGEAYSFSIEARREWGEDYSAVSGLFRQYELAFTWSTQRDALARRVVKDGHAVRMYELQVSQIQREQIFAAVVDATTELANAPRFYNTLTANCTNLLAKIINAAYPDKLPYHYSWNFPGRSDRYLMAEGYIAIQPTPETVIQNANLLPHQELLANSAQLGTQQFNTVVRNVLTPTPQ